MKFEDLQAIWDTQNDRPVFSMNDSRLAVGLYQQREQSRRRIFREQFAPMYVAALSMLAFVGFVFFAFFVKSIFIKTHPRDFPMSAWDNAAFAVAVVALLAVVMTMYAEREKHERTQDVFAPSLREELDRGIAQLDFELALQNTPRVLRILALLSIGVVVFGWEVGRLNGEPAPWMLTLTTLFCTVAGSWAGFSSKNAIVERVMERKRALESMRALLEENVTLRRL